jgi:hypothetical protein
MRPRINGRSCYAEAFTDWSEADEISHGSDGWREQ